MQPVTYIEGYNQLVDGVSHKRPAPGSIPGPATYLIQMMGVI